MSPATSGAANDVPLQTAKPPRKSSGSPPSRRRPSWTSWLSAWRPVSKAGLVLTTEAPTACLLRFDVSGADGSSRVLFYARGDEAVHWELDTR